MNPDPYLLLIDNYDSFTYTLADYFKQLGQRVCVYTHDALTIAEIHEYLPQYIVLSPGPKRPEDAGICMAVIAEFYKTVPILGVCLGHQCIVQAFGGKIIRAPQIMHGKTSAIHHTQQGLFTSLPTPFSVMRYHSLVADRDSLPECMLVDAVAEGVIMAIRHIRYPLFGVQFHPEAYLTEYGIELLRHFLDGARTYATVMFA